MSLKQEIETWVAALEAYDKNNFEEALRQFDQIADTSKILFNCGVIYATLGEHGRAVECYQQAVGLDRYLAIAYFQQGVSNFLLGDFEEALANFNDTLLYLRGNTSIDYEQLGLNFRLFSCEVLFNRGSGICCQGKVTEDHNVIDDAIREHADGYTVFSIPVGALYRPNPAKVKNLKTKDYLGKARLIAAANNQNNEHQWKPEMVIEKLTAEDREGMSWGATHLVHKNLSSRTRQQSEPPLNRHVFPPTPPPEDRAAAAGATPLTQGHSRSSSLRSTRPPRLDLDRTGASLERRPSASDVHEHVQVPNPGPPFAPAPAQKPRIGTTRTASEPRGPPNRQNLRGLALDTGRGQWAQEQQTGHRRNYSDTDYSTGHDYIQQQAYDAYSQPHGMSQGFGRGSRHQPPQYIQEEDEFDSDPCDGEPLNDVGFEIVRPGEAPGQRRTRSPAGYRRATSRRPDVRRFRTKVHAPDDIRYIMIGPTIEYAEFEARIREKFGFQGPLKMRVQDDGDMITMVDQEDLDLLLTSARDVARRERSEMGKMEIWVEEITMI
ncbi:hypothetical protein N7468_002683 [Penicillium chermesinum]|uniref:PB1 domain-containing protein n=1 Tax=Penicillium chermesinum TaxID=63820 RepID=A0A9W9PJ12_9EURO|nr:uncharacterized protein N7468_002683 [Penicillium chermesinum]KAJ5247700.1 hypothetical protein N7468_002683 [Penicillium chermesinum]